MLGTRFGGKFNVNYDIEMFVFSWMDWSVTMELIQIIIKYNPALKLKLIILILMYLHKY